MRDQGNRGRVDPKGVMELGLRPEGEDRIAIELPGAAELAATPTFGKLIKPLPPDGMTMTNPGPCRCAFL